MWKGHNFMIYILYNPRSGNKHAEERANELYATLHTECVIKDISSFDNDVGFFNSLHKDDSVIICGGDGTLNHFINAHYCENIEADIEYCPAGSGNDFANDIEFPSTTMSIPIKKHLMNLPLVEVKGKSYRFLNNVGFGIDGYCCEQGDIKKAKSDKPVNYTTIAIKGLLFDFKPRNATVTVDGITRKYRHVWLAPTMKGRFYGGGMMATPNQNRADPYQRVSLLVCHNIGKVKLLSIFPKIFKGTHIKYKKHVEILQGHEISVTFDRPTPLQIDGETILDVTTYTVKA